MAENNQPAPTISSTDPTHQMASHPPPPPAHPSPMSRPLDSTHYSNSEDLHTGHTSPAVSVVVVRNRAVGPSPWDTEVGVFVQRGLRAELGQVGGGGPA
jgi:hypothetical protein